MENIKSIEEIILIYTGAWNETEHEAIREKIDQCWSAEGTFTDKVTDTITGRDAITDINAQNSLETQFFWHTQTFRYFHTASIQRTAHTKGTSGLKLFLFYS
jgi:hypothetical protein